MYNKIITFILCVLYIRMSFSTGDSLFFIIFPAQIITLIILFLFAAPILCFLYGCRKEMTNEEKAIVFGAFQEVDGYYRHYQSITHREAKQLRLFVDNSMNVNAYAIGSDTIVITRGAIHSLSQDEIKGILAHEIGHLVNGDTMLKLILNMGCVLVLPFVLLARLVDRIREQNILCGVLAFLIFLLTFVFRIIAKAGSRKSEYLADKYAFQLGYGEHLKRALYTISRLEQGKRYSLMERLENSHPNIFMRIITLEKSLGL